MGNNFVRKSQVKIYSCVKCAHVKKNLFFFYTKNQVILN